MKLKILQTVQKNFKVLGVCSNQSRFNGKIVLGGLIYSLGTSFSAIFLIFKANTYEEYTNNLYTTSSLTVGFSYFPTIIFKMKKLFQMIDGMEKNIENKSKNRTSKAIYIYTNRRVEKFTRVAYFAIAIVSPVCIILPKAFVSYFMYFATDLGCEAFELPLFYWFPFDWRNPIGYFVAVIIQYITYACHFSFVACSTTFGFGVFFFAISATKDIQNDLRAINDSAKISKNRLQTLKQISDAVQYYSILKGHVDEFLDIYQPVFLIANVWSLVTICGVMLLVQIEIQGNGSLALIIITICYAFYAFGLWFIICELGQRLSNAFGEIEDVIERFEWNLFALEIQKLLPMILMMVQQPVELCIFGSISALRITFSKVVNSAYSYFSVIRQFLK